MLQIKALIRMLWNNEIQLFQFADAHFSWKTTYKHTTPQEAVKPWNLNLLSAKAF